MHTTIAAKNSWKDVFTSFNMERSALVLQHYCQQPIVNIDRELTEIWTRFLYPISTTPPSAHKLLKSDREHQHVYHEPSEGTGHPAGASIPNPNKAVASGAVVNVADGCFHAFIRPRTRDDHLCQLAIRVNAPLTESNAGS